MTKKYVLWVIHAIFGLLCAAVVVYTAVNCDIGTKSAAKGADLSTPMPTLTLQPVSLTTTAPPAMVPSESAVQEMAAWAQTGEGRQMLADLSMCYDPAFPGHYPARDVSRMKRLLLVVRITHGQDRGIVRCLLAMAINMQDDPTWTVLQQRHKTLLLADFLDDKQMKGYQAGLKTSLVAYNLD